MLAAKAVLYALPSFSASIRSGFPALICYTILLTCRAFLGVKEIVIVSPIEDVTVTSRGLSGLGLGTSSPSLLRTICGSIGNSLLFCYALVIFRSVATFFLAIWIRRRKSILSIV